MEIIPVSSYHDFCDPYVLAQYRDSTRLRALVDAVLAQCDDLEQAFHEIAVMIDPQQAQGDALNFIGALVGVIRKLGEQDEPYLDRVLYGPTEAGLPALEELRRALMFLAGLDAVGLYPDWPAALYYVINGSSSVDLGPIEREVATSGVSLTRGTFLRMDEGYMDGAWIVSEDTGKPFVIDYHIPETLYDLVDSSGDDLVDSNGNDLVALDY